MPRREPITRESLLDPEGTHCDRMRAELRDRLDRVSWRGTRGEIPPSRAPGYAVGIKATAELLDRYDPKPREPQGPAVNIQAVVLVLSEPASKRLVEGEGTQLQAPAERPGAVPADANAYPRTALPAHGVVLHLDGGNGSGA